MAKKNYDWLFYLIENHLTPEKGDYFAKVNSRKTKMIEDIADRIVSERTEYRKETIINIATMINDVKKEFLGGGNSVNDGFTLYEPVILGSFEGETNFNETKNACAINTRLTNDGLSILPQIKATYSGLTVDNGGAVIEKVVDSASGTSNELLTPGKVITITGKKIRIVPQEGEREQDCVIFENEDHGSTYVLEDPIITNDPSKVVVQLPHLDHGTYKLTIKTVFSNNSTLLKEPRFITFKIKLNVH
jgi:hypothetical protein